MADPSLPMTYLQAFGAKAEQIVWLTWGLLILSVAVVVIVAALVLAGSLFRRLRLAPGSHPPLERPAGGLGWIYAGVGVSTLALLGAMVWNGWTMAAIRRPPGSGPGQGAPLRIEVRGHQWWWQIRYLSEDDSRIFDTANEIHIPVGRPVEFRLDTADVIHSFWVPALGDKTDLIPNQTNVNWFQADRPGIYRGQCAEFCGRQHAHMALAVVAEKPEDFRAWWDGQLRPAAIAPGREDGAALFTLRCGACHAVRGTRAGGRAGPDLTHLMSRRGIAAGTLPNTVAHLSGWIADPQGVKPGARMPELDLSGPDLAGIRGFLETLK